MKNIVIEPIGEFKPDPNCQEFYETEHTVFVPFCDAKLSFSFIYDEQDTAFVVDAKAILDEFLALTLKHRNKISHCVLKNCQDFLDMIEYDECDEPLHELVRQNDAHAIWQHTKPSHVYIYRDKQTNMMYLLVYFDCDWEMEHGMQLTIEQGMTLTAVSEITCYYIDDGLAVSLKDN